MRYHAPERPQYGSDLASALRIIGPAGPLGALPILNMEPNEDGTWWIRVHLQVSTSTFREYTCCISAIREFMQLWLQDPEAVLKDFFHYDFSMAPARAPRGTQGHSQEHSATTLEDLGLGP
jgi:hypothetical protein